MNEEKWLGCAGPLPMEEFLDGRVSIRKARLYLCACCRLIWDLLTDSRSREGVEVAERLADGRASNEDRKRAYRKARAVDRANRGVYDVTFAPTCTLLARPSLSHMAATTANHSSVEIAVFCDLLRELFGNPFRAPRLDPACLGWDGGLIPKLAESIYQERAFDRMPILGDALEESGCADESIVDHCHGPGPHVRGCWVIDLLTGRE
jgi:hypothetical protein